jgi:hypothetical protein
MKNSDQEIEVKFHVRDLAVLERRLKTAERSWSNARCSNAMTLRHAGGRPEPRPAV